MELKWTQRLVNRWRIAGFMVALGLTFTWQAQATDNWHHPWSCRKQITISRALAANTDQTNFPVLIHLTADADLAIHARSDGADFRITTVDGTSLLAHEVEQFDPTTGELVMWVRIPLLSVVSNTVVHLYYGNSAADTHPDATHVWDSSYLGVWHKNDATETTIADSTVSGLTGMKGGGNDQPVEVPGKIGQAQDYATTNRQTQINITCDGSAMPARYPDIVSLNGCTFSCLNQSISVVSRWYRHWPTSSKCNSILNGRLYESGCFAGVLGSMSSGLACWLVFSLGHELSARH